MAEVTSDVALPEIDLSHCWTVVRGTEPGDRTINLPLHSKWWGRTKFRHATMRALHSTLQPGEQESEARKRRGELASALGYSIVKGHFRFQQSYDGELARLAKGRELFRGIDPLFVESYVTLEADIRERRNASAAVNAQELNHFLASDKAAYIVLTHENGNSSNERAALLQAFRVGGEPDGAIYPEPILADDKGVQGVLPNNWKVAQLYVDEAV